MKAASSYITDQVTSPVKRPPYHIKHCMLWACYIKALAVFRMSGSKGVKVQKCSIYTGLHIYKQRSLLLSLYNCDKRTKSNFEVL